MVSAPGRALASWTAARNVQLPALVRHVPLPGLESTLSVVLLTVYSAPAAAAGSASERASPSRAAVVYLIVDTLSLERETTMG